MFRPSGSIVLPFWVGWGGTPRKIGRRCTARFQLKPSPYFWPKSAIVPPLFMTRPKIRHPRLAQWNLNIIYERLLMIVLLIMIKKLLLLNNISNSRLGCKNRTLFWTKIDTLFMTIKRLKNHTVPFGAAHTFITHKRVYLSRDTKYNNLGQ